MNCSLKLFRLVTLVGAVLLIGAPLGTGLRSQDRQAPPSTPLSVRAGEGVFFEYCAGCHGRRADGRGQQALNLVPKPQNLRNAQFVKYLSSERMYTSISGGVRGTAMPSFEMILSPAKRWNVIHYIRSLTADDTINIPNAVAHQNVTSEMKNPLAAGDDVIATGKRVFLNYCTSCHGPAADGKGVIAPNLVPAPRNLVTIASWGEKPFIDYIPDFRLYDSVTNGVPGTSMLPWIGVLSDAERWSTIAYLRARASEERRKAESKQ